MTRLPDLFAALADPTRFAIVERLLAEGEQSAGELADIADITAPAISRHLKVLREAGVVTQRIDGQRRIYAVTPEPLQAISAWAIAHRDFWEGSLDRLEAAIRNRRKESR
ncbi:metalloregulator ArsR/SmtB family transcription factor [Defluviimonas sp. WL0024]|uniref:Metalloregulator ArsR/SmtB family transcription factor n=2 Tax=Albidovulum TaxID=205889 RepID=A0ABT3J2Z5_9RHOB|nr:MULTISPECIES: metalloregulator ArsR/SmtB family transcription factor [Defluviimonas]MCU9849491.1 metalloregulator ArsR/SmtB family transcription factor [Defluviimonas sp. WL0024]MCW3782057.1 metalloregulator ArsR/SmtB family transcription factor [Defluviimonas salinarum]